MELASRIQTCTRRCATGRVPEVGNMTRAFTHAEEMSDVATAYYASSQIMVMLVKQYGMREDGASS